MAYEITADAWWPVMGRSEEILEYKPPGLKRLCRVYAYQKAVWDNSKETEADSGLLGPSFKVVETDWAKVDEKTIKDTDSQYLMTLKMGEKNPQDAINHAVELRKWGLKYARRNRDLDRTVTRRSMAELERKIANAEVAKKVATFVRDASAEFILIAATGGTISGATKLAAIGAGVFLKGAYKYQDTGHLGVAAIEAGTELALAAIPMNKLDEFGDAGKIVIAWFVQAPASAASDIAQQSILTQVPASDVLEQFQVSMAKGYSAPIVELLGDAKFGKNSRLTILLQALTVAGIDQLSPDPSIPGAQTPTQDRRKPEVAMQSALIDMKQFSANGAPISAQDWKFATCRADDTPAGYVQQHVMRLR